MTGWFHASVCYLIWSWTSQQARENLRIVNVRFCKSRYWEGVWASVLIGCRSRTGLGFLHLLFTWMLLVCTWALLKVVLACSSLCGCSPCLHPLWVCVCGIHPQPCYWSNLQREITLAASNKMGRRFWTSSGWGCNSQEGGILAPGVCLMCQLSHTLNSGDNTSTSLKLHYISEAKNWKANHGNVTFWDVSFLIT